MKRYKLENLDCANCAMKIETELKKRPDVEDVSINFPTSTLKIKTADIHAVKQHIRRIEPSVRLVSIDAGEQKGSPVRRGLLLGLFALIYAAGLVLDLYITSRAGKTISFIIFALTYISLGWKVLWKAFRNLLRGDFFDENFLMTVATVGAMLIHAFPEAAGVMLFYSIGLFLEDLALGRSRKSIRSLLAVRPDTARVITAEGELSVAPDDVRPGQLMEVRPGERIPLDGEITKGSTRIDTSALTGEAKPVRAEKGAVVYAGTINLEGLIHIRVTRPWANSSIARILDLVQNALSKKAKTEKFIRSFARIYTPVIVLIAVCIALVPPFLLAAGDFTDWLYRALVILVISCPCALVISIPLGYFAGIGKASSEGILIKGSNYIDALAGTDTFVFDKTGTLTKGNFEVSKINTKNSYSEQTLLAGAALAEYHSDHPIAAAIKKRYGRKTDPANITEHRQFSGMGVQITDSEGNTIAVGNDLLLHTLGVPHGDCGISETVAYVCINRVYAGHIIISDQVKEETGRALRRLRRNGVKKIAMLTGDSADVAADLSARLGIDEYHAGLLPEDKVSRFEQMKDSAPGSTLAFVGDGINDAAVLARADVGLAMGQSGSDAAIETADIVLMDGNLEKISEAVSLSRKTRRIILQNIIFALLVKAAFIGLGSTGLAGMWEAVFADAGVTVLAVLNALRIITKQKKPGRDADPPECRIVPE
ncbi:MAG: cadmium-translocating P-type ATPase [Spirochaetales bacterium]|nr:cadmium-translocating P-type ATPase [Spirochaetales bacterium]